jgi:hypothetical protein
MLPSIEKIDKDFCGGKGAFRLLSSFFISDMGGMDWRTTYTVEDGVEEFMFPVLDRLVIQGCAGLRLKPCSPTFRHCTILNSDQVIASLEESDKINHHASSRAIKLDLTTEGNSGQNIRLFHHYPVLRELSISGYPLMSVEESMMCLTSLESLTLGWCKGISASLEWLSDLSSLKSLAIYGCHGIKSLPPSIQQLTKLQKIEIRSNQDLKEWCESEENKAKLAHINVQVSSLPNCTKSVFTLPCFFVIHTHIHTVLFVSMLFTQYFILLA